MRQLIICFSIFFLTYSSSAHAVDPGSPTVATVNAKISKLPNQNEDVAVLKGQLATMQEFTDDMLSTVYWALGTVVGLTVLLAGFGWFTSIRLHERELQSLRSELNAALATKTSSLQSELIALVEEKTKLISEVSTGTALEKVNDVFSPLAERMSVIDHGLKYLQTEHEFQRLKNEARYWEIKEVPANVLDSYQEILDLAISVKNKNEISQALKRLSIVLQGGTQIFSIKSVSLVASLNSLPSEFQIQADAVREAIRNTTIY